MAQKLIIDENSRDNALWNAITQHNITSQQWSLDIIRIGDPNAPPLGTKDPQVLAWAIANNRIVVTLDCNTLIDEHDSVVTNGTTTPGLLIVRRNSKYLDIVDSLAAVSHCLDPAEMQSQSRYIPL